MKKYKRIVVKIGTSTLAYDTGLLNIRSAESIVKVISDLQNSGKEFIIVSSGSIGMGRGKLRINLQDNDMPDRQACAAVGQGVLMHTYDTLFSAYSHNIAQVLLTRDVIDDEQRKVNIINTLSRLLELKCIPIINENDTVSTEEIEFGENDILSAMAAVLVQADLLIILTDIDGLYETSPKENPNAKFISKVTKINDEIKEMAGKTPGILGRGGMITKIHAAQHAGNYGIDTVILNGSKPKQIYDFMNGKEVGTIFQLN